MQSLQKVVGFYMGRWLKAAASSACIPSTQLNLLHSRGWTATPAWQRAEGSKNGTNKEFRGLQSYKGLLRAVLWDTEP